MKKLIFVLCCLAAATGQANANQYEIIGDAIQWSLPLTALGMTFTENDADGRMQFYKSFGTTFGITYSVKYSVNRTRPNGADYSFPSGHTSASFSSAAYIHQRYGYQKARLAYLAASYVGWSRIQANKHHTTDVLAGAVVGTLSSYFLTNNKDINLGAYKDGDSSGINIQFNW